MCNRHKPMPSKATWLSAGGFAVCTVLSANPVGLYVVWAYVRNGVDKGVR